MRCGKGALCAAGAQITATACVHVTACLIHALWRKDELERRLRFFYPNAGRNTHTRAPAASLYVKGTARSSAETIHRWQCSHYTVPVRVLRVRVSVVAKVSPPEKMSVLFYFPACLCCCHARSDLKTGVMFPLEHLLCLQLLHRLQQHIRAPQNV